MAGVFRKQMGGWRINYPPYVANYFTLYFNKYSPTPETKKIRLRKGFEKM